MKKRSNYLSKNHYIALDKLMRDYFFNDHRRNLLKVLDSKKGRDYYTGVTLKYIEKYVLDMKFSRFQIVDYIFKHHENGNLKALYCSDVKNVVIHKIHYQNNYKKGGRYAYDEKGEYDYFINHLNKFKNGK